MRMVGRITHCETEDDLAGQKKATSGNEGFSRLDVVSIVVLPLDEVEAKSRGFRLLRGL